MCHEIPRAGSFAELRSPRNDKLREKLEPVVGFEPTTDGLQNRCSTTELNWPQRYSYPRAPI
jgi:hypothetical protein